MAIWLFKQAYPFERASLFSSPQSKTMYGRNLKLNKEEFVIEFSNYNCQSDFHRAEIFYVSDVSVLSTYNKQICK